MVVSFIFMLIFRLVVSVLLIILFSMISFLLVSFIVVMVNGLKGLGVGYGGGGVYWFLV